jgi:hypothetical protein
MAQDATSPLLNFRIAYEWFRQNESEESDWDDGNDSALIKAATPESAAEQLKEKQGHNTVSFGSRRTITVEAITQLP